MHKAAICKIVIALPPDAPYFCLVFGNRPGKWPRSFSERLQIALRDPALAWNLGTAHAYAEMPLPQLDWPPQVVAAYEYVFCPERAEENLRIAVELQHPDYREERDVIRALLWCADSSDSNIAQVFDYEPQVVHWFEALFWHCRDRRGDLLYFAQLRNDFPSGRNLLRVAQLLRSRQAVLYAARISRPIDLGQDEILVRQIEQLLGTSAAMGQERALLLFTKFLEQPVESAEEDILTLISRDAAAQATIKKIIQDDALERLKAWRETQLGVNSGVFGEHPLSSTPKSPETP